MKFNTLLTHRFRLRSSFPFVVFIKFQAVGGWLDVFKSEKPAFTRAFNIF